MEDVIIPYELPDVENHSFFFIDQRIDTRLEAKLHQHDAWELYYVVHGHGTRMAAFDAQIGAEISDTGRIHRAACQHSG